ncbi:MAG: amidohydrolase family protein [Myxococcota bacterium]
MSKPVRGTGIVLFLCSLASVWLICAAEAGASPDYDLVIRGGRVIDPGSGLDAVRHIGIRGDRIAALSETPLEGARTIDATGRVVSPGFIDLHTHSATPLGQRYQLMDGVTTALELEAGAHPVADFASELDGAARIHFGASVGWASTRVETIAGLRFESLLSSRPRPVRLRGLWTILRGIFGGPPTEAFTRVATADERARMRRLIEADLAAGALGVGVPLDYLSEGTKEPELRMVFEATARANTLLYIHVRRGVNGDPAGLREALRLARETGAAIHVCHISHNAMRNIDLFLREIREARAEGVDVTTELLPYDAGSALISSAVFSRNWREVFAIDYADVEWAATGMRFDEATWHEYREKHPGGQVVHHYLKPEWTRRALVEPGVIVVSDLLPMVDEESMVAPHNGAFTRILGRHVRERGDLDLVTALSKMTTLPAQRLAKFFPAFERKGRLAIGADADVTVFDPETVIDRATYGDPFQGADGLTAVIVAGRVALEDGRVVEDVFAGRRILHRAGDATE